MLGKRRLFTNLSLRNSISFFSKGSISTRTVLVKDVDRKLFSDVLFELKRYDTNIHSILNDWLKYKEVYPPLEVLWRLDNSDILQFTTFLYYQRHYCAVLNAIFEENLKEEPTVLFQMRVNIVLVDILAIIVNLKKHSNQVFQSVSEEILDNIILKTLEFSESNNIFKWRYLKELKNHRGINESCLKDFALSHIIKLLSHDPTSWETLKVLGIHTKQWTYSKLSESNKLIFNEVLQLVCPELICNEVNSFVCRQSFNWKYMLALISTMVQLPKNSETLKEMVDGWLKDAFEDKNKTLLLTVLIVARHCCAEKARFFNNYSTWFGALPLKTVSNFNFFFEYLTQLVPHEPPLFLKIHVNKVPSAPTSCQSLLVDYVTLAKTQLKDLNETIDYIGLFSDYHETDEEGQESDICRVLLLFKENKEIPKPILEASVFRRQYYENVFLKRLLSVSQEDDVIRAELIRKLHSLGKIPSAIFRKWKGLSR